MKALKKHLPNQKNNIITVKDLLQKSFTIYRRNFPLLFGFSAWLLVPITISFLSLITLDEKIFQIINLTTSVLNTILFIWSYISIVLITPRLLNKEKIISTNLNPIVWQIAIPFFLTTLIVFTLNVLGSFLILPGIIFMSWFYFANIIIIFKEVNISTALKESKNIAKGKVIKIFSRIFFGSTFIFITIIIFYSIISLFFHLISGQDISTFTLLSENLIQKTVFQVLEIITMPLFVLYRTIFYLDISKQNKE